MERYMKQKVCIFGCGRYYELKKETITAKYEIVAFMDNMVLPGEQGEKEGIEIYNPSDYVQVGRDVAIVLMSSEWWDMWEQLKSLKVQDDYILFGSELSPFYDKVEELLNAEKITIKSEGNRVVLFQNNIATSIATKTEMQKYLRDIFRSRDPYINLIANMPTTPVSRRFGTELGSVIDRVYVEHFLGKNANAIKGTVMEIGDSRYMSMFGKNINESIILHVNGWGGKKGNLATGEGIEENSVDCLICTQTLQHIYDIKTSIRNIYKLLKPGGTALITNGCIAQLSLYDYHNWGEYWKCTDLTMKNLFSEVFCEENVIVETYGNMKAAIAFLYGLCAEEIPKEELLIKDEQFPMLVSIVAKK